MRIRFIGAQAIAVAALRSGHEAVLSNSRGPDTNNSIQASATGGVLPALNLVKLD
ncbi:hypothetical protein [Kutzneria sp. 744]|uniref:hypothetical protein n=1 Tax=Kutzneria sp. (strain 744) TaxID=345341 RepID=UPI0004B05C45|nr:hypothetical protein [Kutzneria sp. 744]